MALKPYICAKHTVLELNLGWMDTERLYSVCGAQPSRLGSENHQQEIILLWRQCDVPVTAPTGKCCAPESERRLYGALRFSEVTDIICSFQKPPSNQAHPLCHLEVKLRVSQQSGWESKGKEEWRQTEFQLLSSEMQCVNMPHSLSFIWICLPGEKTYMS